MGPLRIPSYVTPRHCPNQTQMGGVSMRNDSIQKISVSPFLREAVLLLCTAVALTIVSFSQAFAEAPDREWKRCAGEGEVCRFSGTARASWP